MFTEDVEAQPEETVFFTVLCKPKNGASLKELRKTLGLQTVKQLIPNQATIQRVVKGLRALGFTVYDEDPSPIVTASGPVSLFRQVFKTGLVKRIRTDEVTGLQHHFFVVEGPRPNVNDLSDALAIEVQEKPLPCDFSPVPPSHSGFYLRPGDVAVGTRASLVHRKNTPAGERATGAGVLVAMIDAGVYKQHPFYVAKGYDLQVDRASDVTSAADLDHSGHGTRHTAAIFSSAPDASVVGIKMGETWTKPFDRARALHARIITYSQAFNMAVRNPEDNRLTTLQMLLLDIISDGTTIVVSGGDDTTIAFPAMMPEVIAVGGVDMDSQHNFKASGNCSSFRAALFQNRKVPDLCGIASMMALPTSPESTTPSSSGWKFTKGLTSNTAPQVSGIAALLLQKDSSLSPDQVRDALKHARDVKTGKTATGDLAVANNDDNATGAGFVDALAAWLSV